MCCMTMKSPFSAVLFITATASVAYRLQACRDHSAPSSYCGKWPSEPMNPQPYPAVHSLTVNRPPRAASRSPQLSMDAVESPTRNTLGVPALRVGVRHARPSASEKLSAPVARVPWLYLIIPTGAKARDGLFFPCAPVSLW